MADQADIAEIEKGGTPESDAVLVASARTGDYSAFETLVRCYRNDVYRFAWHFVRNREDAWDLSQEVFVKAYQGLASFRGDAPFKAWLLRITANHCRDFIKRRRLDLVQFDGNPAAENTPSAILRPNQAAQARELGQHIDRAIQSLPEKHRTAFLLREVEGLSYEEMAQAMQCNLGTVMSRLHHARRKLQAMLNRVGLGEGSDHV
jgi:RNA polymerase sigma-70 factor (ECF subfamily)